MSSSARLGKGCILERGDTTSPGTYSPIEEILEISGAPGGIPDLISVYNHDSPSLYDEQITGRISQSEMDMTANYINSTTQNVLKADMENGTSHFYKLRVPKSGGYIVCIFEARVRGWVISPPTNAQQTLNFKLAPTGAPIWIH